MGWIVFLLPTSLLWKIRMAKQEGTLTKYTTYTLGLIYESTLSLKG